MRIEFVDGFEFFNVDFIKSFQNKFFDLEVEVINDVEKFKDLYCFIFKFGFDVEEG